MVRPRVRLPVTTSVASIAMLLPTAGCRRPSADLELPEPGRAGSDPQGPARADCPAAPKPPPGSADDRDPPTILGARFIARDRVQLTFSEALAPVTGVNPRQFRLSHGYMMVDSSSEQSYANGYYYDLAGTNAYYPALVVVELELYADHPEILALTLSQPVTYEQCEVIANSRLNIEQMDAEPESGRRGQVGLFLHYTQRGSDGVRDRAANPLQDMGADWALNFGSRHKTMYGSDPVTRFDLLVDLECPDATMPARDAPPGPV